MGTRLYPKTTNPEILERLAQVHPGTYARLTALQGRYSNLASQLPTDESAFLRCERLSYRLYKEVHRVEALASLDSFLTFGWGKLRGPVWDLLKKHPDMVDGDDIYCASCDDIDFCRNILLLQGVELPAGFSPDDFGGLCWG